MSIKITNNQKSSLTNTYKKAVLLEEVNSVTNDLLRPIAEEISVVDYPQSWGDTIPENNDPIAWADFTEKFYGLPDSSPLWNWLFSYSWMKIFDPETDNEDLRLLSIGLEETVGGGFIEAFNAIVKTYGENDETLTNCDALVLRFEVIINNVSSSKK